jgi:hypothetical protein
VERTDSLVAHPTRSNTGLRSEGTAEERLDAIGAVLEPDADRRCYATPWEILRQLPDVASHLKAELTIAYGPITGFGPLAADCGDEKTTREYSMVFSPDGTKRLLVENSR